MKFLSVGILGSIALASSACSKGDDLTEQQRLCLMQQFPQYDARQLEQCVSACKACRNGNTATCTTSCKLKGAT